MTWVFTYIFIPIVVVFTIFIIGLSAFHIYLRFVYIFYPYLNLLEARQQKKNLERKRSLLEEEKLIICMILIGASGTTQNCSTTQNERYQRHRLRT